MNKRSDKEKQLCGTSEKRKVIFTEAEMQRMKTDIGIRIIQAFNYRTDTEIASLLKISNKTVKSFVDGEEFPPTEILLSIHQLTGSSLDWLLTGKEAKQTAYIESLTALNDATILGLA
ncbi:MAG TPA: helix-turn-helix domain-containing protein [Pyrinomonadaceae bacterium]|jgi:transcriptional regulator with XRE-family HTH domain